MIIPEHEIAVRTSRSSGPGGQHANKTESRVEAVFDVLASTTLTEAQKQKVCARWGAVVTCVVQDSRSQHRNRAVAVERVQWRVADALRPRRPRRPSTVSRAIKKRRVEAKRRVGERKQSRRKPTGEE